MTQEKYETTVTQNDPRQKRTTGPVNYRKIRESTGVLRINILDKKTLIRQYCALKH
jgi:hypothetical protein